ncbi:GtrA-like protein [Prevotella sp. DNF00663]|uniref:GtrA family protein n=1 Tax=unclassified Prevotella TaxID=2638335 RepID=UPI0005137D9E|nr:MULTISPECIES: GtrA family protein [unclassified Prevotella]KGI60934.1 polysaccharide biosynthesis protein GtrA [Prevotella sp. S7 MS 2]KXB81924.1 GtrA-like protein [Prevotella sp. DNF00663]
MRSYRVNKQFGEIIRFGIVGGLATLLQYGIYLLLLKQMGHNPAMTIGYAISFIFNYLASTYFTFRVKASAKRGAGFALSHVVNYLLQMGTLNFFLWVGVPKTLAPIPMFCVCVPVNFLLVRYFLKRK